MTRRGCSPAWEAAAGLPRAARGAALVHAAGLAADLDAALDLPIGVAAALAVRAQVDAFGAATDGVLACGACGQELDVPVPLAELRGEPAAHEAVVQGLTVRAPTTRDLLVAGSADELLARCVHDASGAPVDAEQLEDELLEAVDAAAEELAGAAGLVLRASCPECGAPVSAALDPAALLWEQVAAAVPAALAEVAELAAAFGWSERDVLALTAPRRRAYLELARGGR